MKTKSLVRSGLLLATGLMAGVALNQSADSDSGKEARTEAFKLSGIFAALFFAASAGE